MSTGERAANGDENLSDGRRLEGLMAENARLCKEIGRLKVEARDFARLQEAMLRLERERVEVAAERDSYRKSLLALTRKEFTITQEEIDDMDKNGVTLDDRFFEELERDMRAQGSFDG